MKTYTVQVMQYHELDDLVNATWPEWKGQFNCIAEFEWNNCEDHMTTEIGQTFAERYKTSTATEAQKLDWASRRTNDACEWARGKRPLGNGIHQLLQALYDEGALAAGNYVVHVFW